MTGVVKKSLIYRTDVGEGSYAATHVVGCSHGCRFPCYAFLMMQRFGKVATYEEWCQPRLVSNAVQLAQRELPHLREKAKYVCLSFATDPFMFRHPEVTDLTLQLMKLINAYDIPVHTLTKGIIPEEALLLSHTNEFEITLVSLEDQFRVRYEPGTAPYPERIEGLRRAHDHGLRTFVNMEPYPTPNMCRQDIRQVLHAVDFVDGIRLGQLNYNNIIRRFPGWRAWYRAQGAAAREWCLDHDIAYEGIEAHPATRRSSSRSAPEDLFST